MCAAQVTGSHDRSIRLWERTEEPLFVEEEREQVLNTSQLEIRTECNYHEYSLLQSEVCSQIYTGPSFIFIDHNFILNVFHKLLRCMLHAVILLYTAAMRNRGENVHSSCCDHKPRLLTAVVLSSKEKQRSECT